MTAHADLNKAIFYTPEERALLRKKQEFQAKKEDDEPKQADLQRLIIQLKYGSNRIGLDTI